jgi:hypothetical protein
MFLAFLLATLAGSPQDPAHEPTLLERIDALIAKTNGYEHFVARYRLHSKTGEEGELRLCYRAPDWAKVESKMKDSVGEFAMLDGTLNLRMHTPEGKSLWAILPDMRWGMSELEELRSRMQAALPDRFHGEDLPSGSGVLFSFSLDETPPAGKDGLNFNLSFSVGPTPRFSWLAQARSGRKQIDLRAEDPDLIGYSPSPSVRILISAESGLVQRVERREGDQRVAVLTLESLDLSTAPERAEFELPPAEAAAQDVSEDARRSMGSGVVQQTRSFLYQALQKMSADGRLRWDEQTREKLRALFAAEHARLAEHTLRDARTKISVAIDASAAMLREGLASAEGRSDEGRKGLAAQTEVQRKQLTESCATLATQYASLVFGRLDVQGTLPIRAELEELEKAVAGRAFEQALTSPVLAEFEEKVGKQLEAK